MTSSKKIHSNTVKWDEAIIANDCNPSWHKSLWVEVFGQRSMVHKLAGFATIHLDQVARSPNGSLKGEFELFDMHGRLKGTSSLTISAVDANILKEPEMNREEAERRHSDHIRDMVNPIDNILLVQGKVASR